MLAENSPSFTCMPGAPISRTPFSSANAHPSARHQPLRGHDGFLSWMGH
jgi:hypothetical protein